MMKAYLKRNKEVKNDLQTIIGDKLQRVQVWRVTNNGVVDPGFEEVSTDLQKIATIKARIDLLTGTYQRSSSVGIGDQTEIGYVGATEYTDVRIKDEWRVDGYRYEVEAVNHANGPMVEAILRRLE